jgi:iron complex outermembrane receptor protein
MARATLLLAFVLIAAPMRAQSADHGPVPGWTQQLTDLEARVKAVRADDRTALDRTATALHDLDLQISTWLADRGLTTEPPPPESSRLQDLSAELSRVRALIAQARAGSVDDPQGAGVFYLGRQDVTVSARAGSPGVTTVDASEMRTLDAKTVNEALAAAPGVTLYRTGPRNEGAVYIRGFDLRQIPLFIDGIPVYVPYDGYVDLDRFVTDDLSEVRVTKGMTSVLIGPNALGGAINLVTKRPTQLFEGLFNVTYGSGNERAFDANVGTMHPVWYFHGTGSWLESDNFPLAGSFVPTGTENGGARDNSARRDGKASAKFAWTPSGKGEYALSYVLQRGRKDDPVYTGSDALVKPRYWQWPDWDKDSVSGLEHAARRQPVPAWPGVL